MITTLTPEQKAMLPIIRDRWIAHGLSTEPVDESKVRTILTRMYAVVGKPGPRNVVICDSPLSLCWTIVVLRSLSSVRDSVRDSVSDSVRDSVCVSVRDSVRDSVSVSVRDSVSDSVRDSVRASVRDSVRDSVSVSVIDSVRDSVSVSVGDLTACRWWGFGQYEAYWCSYYDVIALLGIDCSRLDPQLDFCRSAGWSVLFWDFAFVSRRPTCIHRDALGRLHCEDGQALAYPDGFAIHAIHGVRVPSYVIEAPETITIDGIRAQANAEVRRVMIDRFGSSRYLIASGAKELHRDDYGTLYRTPIPGDEDLVMVKVINSTPEPDGTFRDYFLRVPPSVKTAREAVAWTFDIKPTKYALEIET